MNIIEKLTGELNLKTWQTEATIKLLDEGNTVPFIARYRKEVTGSLDDQILRELSDRLSYLRNMDETREKIKKSIEDFLYEEEGNITGEIVSIIYKGDHYQVIVRTEEDEDFVVDTEYTWNESDLVNVKIAPEKIKMTLKQEAKNYVKD